MPEGNPSEDESKNKFLAKDLGLVLGSSRGI
jgi:hypothetical protein